MKLNNKGFAISIILYSISAVIVLVLLLILSVDILNAKNASNLIDKVKEDISEHQIVNDDIPNDGTINTTILTVSKSPTTAVNSYYKSQIFTPSYNGNNMNGTLYYYIKTTRDTYYDGATIIEVCGSGSNPSNCTSGTNYKLEANIWYKFNGKPKIYNTDLITTTATIYAAIGNQAGDITPVVYDTLGKIDTISPNVNITSARYIQGKLSILYNLVDEHSGIANYTCEMSYLGSNGVSGTSSTSGVSSSSGGSSITIESVSSSACYAPINTNKGDIMYRICATDGVGNPTTCDGGTYRP